MQLRGVQALITSGSSEIGRAVAVALAELGAAGVAMDYDHRYNEACATCKEIEVFRTAKGATSLGCTL
jgi:NAD(P)-dependent dehydrogenase (short-subunit alcohol dehydrogenase family)